MRSSSFLLPASLLYVLSCGGVDAAPPAPTDARSPVVDGRWKLVEMVKGETTHRIEGATQELLIEGDHATWTAGTDACRSTRSSIPVRRSDAGRVLLVVSAGRAECSPSPCEARYTAVSAGPTPKQPWEGRAVVCPLPTSEQKPDYEVVSATDRTMDLRAQGSWTLRFQKR